MKDNFLLKKSQQEVFDNLTDEEAGKLIKGIFRYATTGKSDLEGVLNAIFIPIKNEIDKNEKKYQEICERNRKNGANGGRPKKDDVETQNNPVGYFGKNTHISPIIDKEKNNKGVLGGEEEKENTDKADDTETRETKKTLFDYVESVFPRIFNGPEQEVINGWIDNDVTRFAIGQAAQQGISNVKYIDAILEAYKKEKITTVEQAKAREKEFQERKKRKQAKEPNWLNQNINSKTLSDDEITTMNELLREFKR